MYMIQKYVFTFNLKTRWGKYEPLMPNRYKTGIHLRKI